MPLIKSRMKSEKAPEMDSQSPNLSVAYGVQRRNKRKMAQGGQVIVKGEKEASADNQDDLARGHERQAPEAKATTEPRANAQGSKSIAEAIRMRKMYAEGGEVDLSRNADEDANLEDQLSFDALRKENYSESEGLEDLDYDTDKSLGHELSDEDQHAKDLVSMIRNKMKSKL